MRARRPLVLSMLAGAWLATVGVSSSQSLATPLYPQTSDLRERTHLSERFLELRFHLSAATNVRPLLQEHRSSDFDGVRAFLEGMSVYEARLRLAQWELGFAYGQADDYDGNSGAARLFLEAEQGQLRPDTSYPVSATLNRTAAHWWTLAYHGNWETSSVKGRYSLGLSYLSLQRVQQGWLEGQKRGDSFEGELTLLTTRGVPAPAIGGTGYSLSVGVALEWEGWSAVLSVQNLWSQLRVRQAQAIEAAVRVNRPVPDADGFLRAPPVLEGQVRSVRLWRVARPCAEIGLWRRTGSTKWGLIARHDDDWHAALAFRRRVGRDAALWTAFWQPYPMLSLGYEQPNWRIVLGTDAWNRSALKRFHLELSWTIALK
ncbi:MAG: hypothetical protein N2651_06845 [Fimbriimonadales bacterium]|nr:hypothetical protein [Fimbriimonadales bacterium]